MKSLAIESLSAYISCDLEECRLPTTECDVKQKHSGLNYDTTWSKPTSFIANKISEDLMDKKLEDEMMDKSSGIKNMSME
jgi:hypothetical protein